MSSAALGTFLLAPVDHARAVVLAPSDAFMSAFHAPVAESAGVPQTRANAFTILTNGVVDRADADRIDTWNEDHLGQTLDFVGLQYSSVNRFDNITIELGKQFGDGGDWDSVPKVYILKNPTLVGDTVEPNMSPNWIELAGATETTGHVFSPVNTPGDLGAAGQIRFDLSAIPADQRTGWGWAVGGVDGNANTAAPPVFHFISVTEAFAEGEAVAETPTFLPPLTPVPVNVVANSYNTVARNGDGLDFTWRGQALASVTNGLLDRNVGLANDGFDTYEGDADGTLNDFVGLQYASRYTFDTLTVELGNQFADGGDWEATPRIFILKNPVDTDTTRPETDPANWVEITGAVETTGHLFDEIVVPGAGGTVSFDLTSIPAHLRSGWGWAIGGVDGNQNAEGAINFISVTELAATGSLVPEPTSCALLAICACCLGVWRRSGAKTH